MLHSNASPDEASYGMTKASYDVSDSVNNNNNSNNKKQKNISYLDEVNTNEMISFHDGNNEQPIYRNDEERAVLQPMAIEI